MKMNYFGYYLVEKKTNKRIRVDLRQFFAAFSSFENKQYKNSFMDKGENVYLLQSAPGLFLYIMTQENDVMMRVNRDDLSLADVRDLLERSESLGAASYLTVKRSYMGFGYTIKAPRIQSFCRFVDSILESVGLFEYSFGTTPLQLQTTPAEAAKMSFLGTAKIEVNPSHSFYQNIQKYLGLSDDAFEEMGAVEVVLKPIARKNIAEVGRAAMKQFGTKGVDKFIVRGKEDLHDKLTDLYLIQGGVLGDNVDISDSKTVAAQIDDNISRNEALKKKVKDHEADKAITQKRIARLDRLSDGAAWDDSVGDIQDGS